MSAQSLTLHCSSISYTAFAPPESAWFLYTGQKEVNAIILCYRDYGNAFDPSDDVQSCCHVMLCRLLSLIMHVDKMQHH